MPLRGVVVLNLVGRYSKCEINQSSEWIKAQENTPPVRCILVRPLYTSPLPTGLWRPLGRHGVEANKPGKLASAGEKPDSYAGQKWIKVWVWELLKNKLSLCAKYAGDSAVGPLSVVCLFPPWCHSCSNTPGAYTYTLWGYQGWGNDYYLFLTVFLLCPVSSPVLTSY